MTKTATLVSPEHYILVPGNLLGKLPAFLANTKLVNASDVIQFDEPFKNSGDFIQRTDTTILVGSENYAHWLERSARLEQNTRIQKEKKNMYDIPLINKLPLVGVPSQAVVKFAFSTASEQDERLFYLVPIGSKLDSVVAAVREWYHNPNMGYVVVRSSTEYIELQQNTTGGKAGPYFILLSHRDKNLISLMIPLQR